MLKLNLNEDNDIFQAYHIYAYKMTITVRNQGIFRNYDDPMLPLYSLVSWNKQLSDQKVVNSLIYLF